MYAHIEYQLLGAALYGAYALARLSACGNRSMKFRVLLAGYIPGLLAGLAFVLQFLITSTLPGRLQAFSDDLHHLFAGFFSNWMVFALLCGLVASIAGLYFWRCPCNSRWPRESGGGR